MHNSLYIYGKDLSCYDLGRRMEDRLIADGSDNDLQKNMKHDMWIGLRTFSSINIFTYDVSNCRSIRI